MKKAEHDDDVGHHLPADVRLRWDWSPLEPRETKLSPWTSVDACAGRGPSDSMERLWKTAANITGSTSGKGEKASMKGVKPTEEKESQLGPFPVGGPSRPSAPSETVIGLKPLCM